MLSYKHMKIQTISTMSSIVKTESYCSGHSTQSYNAQTGLSHSILQPAVQRAIPCLGSNRYVELFKEYNRVKTFKYSRSRQDVKETLIDMLSVSVVMKNTRIFGNKRYGLCRCPKLLWRLSSSEERKSVPEKCHTSVDGQRWRRIFTIYLCWSSILRIPTSSWLGSWRFWEVVLLASVQITGALPESSDQIRLWICHPGPYIPSSRTWWLWGLELIYHSGYAEHLDQSIIDRKKVLQSN